MAIKLGINGFGRIGRLVFRAAVADGGIDIVGINDLSDAKSLAHLVKYDTAHGKFDGDISADGNNFVLNGTKIPVSAQRNPADLPWKALGVDVVLESTGIFRTREKLELHLQAGAPKVLLSVPPKDKIDAVILLGVNDDELKPEHKLVSNASCTTNSLAPMAKVLHEQFGIQKGFMTTIHSYTNDQSILDMIHSDLRRARSAAVNIIPTTTGAAKAIGQVLPELDGKLDGMAIRVPTHDASITDLVVEVEKATTKDAVNAAFKAAADGKLKGILEYCDEPIVSSDVIGNPASSIIDALSTNVIGGNLVKTLSWYDNEWGYSNRCVDLIKRMVG
ncbi:MAG: type I glyceraldehyde-3-phosphate dehydrogenase [Candidatus Latescibacteria bacterium]|nr:type I glyceraldehyde-3-phosphate dehydrogenase [Candidatus Latescibacterota bacterium]